MNMDRAREFIGDSDTPATVLHVILLKKYGIEFLYGDGDSEPVDPIILWNTVEEDFRISIPVEVENKVNAIMLAVSTDMFFKDPQAFASVCLAVAQGDLGDMVNGDFDNPSVAEMLMAIREVDINDGDKEIAFHPNVKMYIQGIMESESVDSTDEVDPYVEDTNMQVLLISECLKSLGAPEQLVTPDSESDFYGLFD